MVYAQPASACTHVPTQKMYVRFLGSKPYLCICMVAEATRSERRSQRNMANNANVPNGNGDVGGVGVGVAEQPSMTQVPSLVQATPIGSTSITATSSVGGGVGRVRPREESVATPETAPKQPRAKFDSPLQSETRAGGSVSLKELIEKLRRYVRDAVNQIDDHAMSIERRVEVLEVGLVDAQNGYQNLVTDLPNRYLPTALGKDVMTRLDAAADGVRTLNVRLGAREESFEMQTGKLQELEGLLDNWTKKTEAHIAEMASFTVQQQANVSGLEQQLSGIKLKIGAEAIGAAAGVDPVQINERLAHIQAEVHQYVDSVAAAHRMEVMDAVARARQTEQGAGNPFATGAGGGAGGLGGGHGQTATTSTGHKGCHCVHVEELIGTSAQHGRRIAVLEGMASGRDAWAPAAAAARSAANAQAQPQFHGTWAPPTGPP